jgi:hypothetical protein
MGAYRRQRLRKSAAMKWRALRAQVSVPRRGVNLSVSTSLARSGLVKGSGSSQSMHRIDRGPSPPGAAAPVASVDRTSHRGRWLRPPCRKITFPLVPMQRKWVCPARAPSSRLPDARPASASRYITNPGRTSGNATTLPSAALTVMVAFDLLYLNGDLRELPLVQREAEFKKIIAGTDIQISKSLEIDWPRDVLPVLRLTFVHLASRPRQP